MPLHLVLVLVLTEQVFLACEPHALHALGEGVGLDLVVAVDDPLSHGVLVVGSECLL